MQPGKRFLVWLAGLSVLGFLATDMYLPAFAAIQADLQTPASAVSASLSLFLAGFAAAQLLWGPLSDRYGRKPVLLIGLTIFALGSLGMLWVENAATLLVLRFVQGVAGAGGVVLSRSIATDKYSARELATMLAIIGAINGIATVAAPIAGGVLAEGAGWHGIFWFLFLLGGVLLCCSFRMQESLPAHRRPEVNWKGICRNFGTVLSNRRYLFYILQYGFTMGVLFVNIASAPFIMQQHYGLSPMMFSLCFGINAIAMVISSTISVKLPTMEHALHIGSNGMLVVSACLLVCLSLNCNFWIYEILIFCLLAMVGMSYTASNALAMDCERRYAGIASALLGAIGFLFGGLVPPLVGLGDMMYTAGVLFLAGAVCAYLCARYAMPVREGEKNLLYRICYVMIHLPYTIINRKRG